MSYIELFPKMQMLEHGTVQYVRWEYTSLSHIALTGSTGSGKSYCLKLLLGRISHHIPDSKLVVADYKGNDEDFGFLRGSRDFYRFDECCHAVDYVTDLLKQRQQGNDSDRAFVALVFDEWSAYLSNMDKKQAEQEKQKLAALLMLGRSFNIHVIISQQRLDSVYFSNARDNFSVICGLGRLSKESVDMVFSPYKELIKPKPRGQGYMLMGDELIEIVVPRIRNPEKLNTAIWMAVNR